MDFRSTRSRCQGTPHRQLSLFLATALAIPTACVSAKSVALDPAAPRVPFHASQLAQEEEYTTRAGDSLGYVAYRDPAAEMALVYLHGIQSHAGWFAAAADGLAAAGLDVYCLDRRGSGINRENRGHPSGHVVSRRRLMEDIEDFLATLAGHYAHVYLVGLSWGGKLATAYALERPEDVDGLVLITPGLAPRVNLGLLAKVGVFFCSFAWPGAQFRIPIEVEMFSSDPHYTDLIRGDPLRLERVSARFCMVSRALDARIRRRIAENRLPILLILADQDPIIDNQAVVELLERGGLTLADQRLYENQRHSVQFDATDRLVMDILDWVAARPAALHDPTVLPAEASAAR